MNTFLQDLRYGVRSLLKSPGFTVVAVVALALGIGANTAIFSVVNGVLLRPLPYKDPGRLVMLWETRQQTGNNIASIAPPNLFDLRDQNHVFDNLSGVRAVALNLTGSGAPEQIIGAGVSADFFQMLGVEPAHGRAFLPEEDQANASPVVIISHALWQRRFGSETDIIGQSLTLSGKSYTVIGVTPQDFRPTEAILFQGADLWIPLAMVEDDLKNRGNHFLNAIGRLKPGIALEQAQAEADAIAGQLEQTYAQTNRGVGFRLVPLKQQTVGDVGKKLYVLLGAVGFVLLIACANVANMLLAKAAGREKEIAIRMALGASRSRLIRQLLTESLLLGVTGGLLGLLLSLWGVDALVGFSPADVPRLQEINVDVQVLVFTLLMSLLTGVIFGLAPALHSSKPDINRAIKEGGGAADAAVGGNRLRSLMVVAEVAMVMVLLVGAGLLLNSFLRLVRVSPGFNADRVVAMRVSLSPRYDERPQQIAFFKELLGRLEAAPGLESVGAINDLPFSGSSSTTAIAVEAAAPAEPGTEPQADWRQISPNYFGTMAIPLLVGRDFTERDDRNGPPVTIINEALARRFWPDGDPIGRRIKLGGAGSPNPWMTVVGVVGDIKHHSLSAGEGPVLYLPYLRIPRRGMYIVARAGADPSTVLATMQREVWAIDGDQPIGVTRTMDQFLSRSVSEPRFYSLLLGLFAAVATVIAAVGVYGIMSYSVAQRTHEIGIRMALGATSASVLGLVVRRGMALAAAGIVIGLGAALALTRVLSSLLYEVTPTDTATFAAMTLLLALVALMASLIPARRATRVDPMVALRYE